MRRREFIAALGGAVTMPLAARAQQPAVPVVGILGAVAPEPWAANMAAMFQALKEAGYIEGQNLRVEQRWARGQLNQLPRCWPT